MARCHLIISHPSKPKFLAIKLSDGSWSPPWVSVPDSGFVGSRAREISQGVREHYGLNTTVLRHLFESPKYHCLELEVHSRAARQNYHAIWVGQEDYRKSRNFPSGNVDPFELWLRSANQPEPPKERLPWERAGWFREASHWFLHQLDSHGIQVTGSVEQFRAAWQRSAILRVRTTTGYCYFKAALDTPPNEAALTLALSERWPGLVPRPLAVDNRRNWMISRDFLTTGPVPSLAENYAPVARSLAELQIESLPELDRWQALGCPRRDIETLSDFLGRPERLHPMLRDGQGALDKSEIVSFDNQFNKLSDKSQKLTDYGVPDALVHADFKPANVYRHEQGYWLTDWADTIIAHPFYSLVWFTEGFLLAQKRRSDPGVLSGEIRLALDRVTEAYLEPFRAFADPESLREALALATEFAGICRLQRWWEILPRLERESRGTRRVEAAIRKQCRLWAREGIAA